MLVLHGLELFVAPPARYPDLYPALFSIYGAANLTAAYLYGVAWQFRAAPDSDLLVAPSGGKKATKSD